MNIDPWSIFFLGVALIACGVALREWNKRGDARADSVE